MRDIMRDPIQLAPRNKAYGAIHVVIGQVSKSEILSFCPHANVRAIEDDMDIRWCVITDVGEVTDGDYIIRVGDSYIVMNEVNTKFIFEGIIPSRMRTSPVHNDLED